MIALISITAVLDISPNNEKSSRQNITDLTSIDLKTLSVIIRDNMNKVLFLIDKSENHPYPPGSQENTPNWYYYWTQDVPKPVTITSRLYVDVWESPQGYVMKWVPSSGGSTFILVYQSGGISNDERTDYHWCTSRLAHENQHEYDFRNEVWGGEPYNPNEDQDGNFLRDSWEIEQMKSEGILSDCINATPTQRFEICYRDWAEGRAELVEKNYPDYSSTKDWAFPGSNYK